MNISAYQSLKYFGYTGIQKSSLAVYSYCIVFNDHYLCDISFGISCILLILFFTHRFVQLSNCIKK